MNRKLGILAIFGLIVLSVPTYALTQTEVDSLNKAIDLEYHAYSTYEAAVNKFGNIWPFAQIMKAEQTHIDELKILFEAYGLDIPENPYKDVNISDNVQDLCKSAADEEIYTADWYESALKDINEEDIKFVYERLMYVTKYHHLPAFQRCSEYASEDVNTPFLRQGIMYRMKSNAMINHRMRGPVRGDQRAASDVDVVQQQKVPMHGNYGNAYAKQTANQVNNGSPLDGIVRGWNSFWGGFYRWFRGGR